MLSTLDKRTLFWWYLWASIGRSTFLEKLPVEMCVSPHPSSECFMRFIYHSPGGGTSLELSPPAFLFLSMASTPAPVQVFSRLCWLLLSLSLPRMLEEGRGNVRFSFNQQNHSLPYAQFGPPSAPTGWFNFYCSLFLKSEVKKLVFILPKLFSKFTSSRKCHLNNYRMLCWFRAVVVNVWLLSHHQHHLRTW